MMEDNFMENNNNKRVTASIVRTLITIVTLLCLLLGTCTVVRESWKIVKTGVMLIELNNNATDYNEAQIKTNQMTEEYLENQAEREKFYQSEDTVIRVYSNFPTIVKLLVLLLAIYAIPGVPFMVLLYVVREVYATRKRSKRRKAENQ